MRPTGRLVLHAANLLCLAASLSLVARAQELSHARIVRLSFAEGVVTVHRPDVGEWAQASVNTPIQEGFKVATDEGGFAEIEFENASTARIGQGTLLEFTQLALLPSGGKVNKMTLLQGYATFNFIPEENDTYEVTVGTATLTPQGKSRFRVDMEDGLLQVKVFKGSVEIMSPEGTGTLGKNTVLEIRPGSDQPFEISQGITKDDWDKWVEEREERTEMVRNMGAQRVFPGYSANTNDLLWGAMDLMYYGTWISDPFYGYGWVPTASLGWSPFTQGRWTWYPGWGYTWIGMEPWGWLPYHYGSWTYNAGIGWCWFPMGGFGSWSPATVQWYQGSGWVGWTPRSPVAGGFDSNCPRSDGCVAIASEGRLTAGGTIQPGDLRWGRHHDLGQSVERVNLSAGREAMRTGTPYDFSRGFGRTSSGRESAGGVPDSGISVVGGTADSRPAPGLVYDPATRSYVNNPTATREPSNSAAPGSADISSGAPRGGFAGVSRPGPTNNYPVFPTQAGGRQSGAAPRGDASRGESSNDSSDWIRSNAVGWGNNSDSRSSSGGRSDSGSRASSGSGSSSSSGGGRSSGGSSASSGGGGSSGSRSSGGGSSGGWGGGGSSSGGHSSGGGGGGHSSGGGGGGFGGGGGHSSGGGGGYGGGGGGGHSSGGGGGGHSSGGGSSSSSRR